MATLPATPGPVPATQPGGAPSPPLRSAVLSLGSHVPDRVLGNAELERMVDTSDSWIVERTGIHERRVVGPGETASVLGARAARVALERAGNPAVDALICATTSPDTLMPSTACLVQRRLGLFGQPAFDLGAACSGFVYGLTLADSLVRSGAARTVLLVAAEAMTSLVDFGDRSTSVLFGDGAGAAVIGGVSAGGLVASRWGADGREAGLLYYGAGSGVSGDAVRMDGRGTFRLAVERMASLAVELCADAGWSLSDVSVVVPHQANLRIIEAVARRLSFPMERVVFNGDRFGNTSGASIPLALDEAACSGRLNDGDRVLCLAFGAGATWGGVAMEWHAGAVR